MQLSMAIYSNEFTCICRMCTYVYRLFPQQSPGIWAKYSRSCKLTIAFFSLFLYICKFVIPIRALISLSVCVFVISVKLGGVWLVADPPQWILNPSLKFCQIRKNCHDFYAIHAILKTKCPIPVTHNQFEDIFC